MARTYRRKSGCKWWRNRSYSWIYIDNPSWEEIDIHEKEQISRYEKRDLDISMGLNKRMLKWHSNVLRRSGKREQIHKIMKESDYNNCDYDNTKELKTKMLAWVYD